MKVTHFISDHLLRRLAVSGCLVVYDETQMFHDVVKGLAGEKCVVIDATDSIILAREAAMAGWLKLARSNREPHQLIVYVPSHRPETIEQKCRDPFQSFALGGAVFPSGDGDSYLALCRMAKPEHAQKIEELFKSGVPDFATIDNVGAGHNWPKLRSLLGVESSVETLTAFLSPSETQRTALTEDGAWAAELREFLQSTLGFQPKTKSQKWQPICDEVWRFVLFSEFVFDLPAELPSSLSEVPRAGDVGRGLVLAACQALRTSDLHKDTYIVMANKVAAELNLETLMASMSDLGKLDTFAFEERSFLRVFTEAALAGDMAKAKDVADTRKSSLWIENTERQVAWTIAERARQLIVAADDLRTEFSKRGQSLADIIAFYTERGFQLDTFQRNFEQAIGDAYGELGVLEELVAAARQQYKQLAESMQSAFISAVEKEGWPASGSVRSTEVFDKYVAPALKDRGTRVALFMVDSLRYELAVWLERQMAKESDCELIAICAQLPTITPVGMAALLPEASGNLRLTREGDELVPTIKGTKIVTPADRFDYVRSIYGERCAMVELQELLAMSHTGKKKSKLAEGVHLLLVRTTDIDRLAEDNPAKARELMPRLLQEILAGLNKLKKLGFDEAEIGTDHGFVLLSAQEPGDVVAKPPGSWLKVKDRCLLGSGSNGAGCILFPKDDAGIQGDFDSYVVPRSFGTFSHRIPYFHEGLSLQECVLPLICVRMSKEAEKEKAQMEVQLGYKGGRTTQVTTRLPLVDISVFRAGLFDSTEIELRIEAWSKDLATGKDHIVGEPASSEYVHPATGVVHVRPGQAVKVPLRLEEGFSGSFEVRVLDPETLIAYAEPLKLKTHYLE